MAYGQGQEDSSTQALEVFGEKQGEVDINQLMETLKVLLPLIIQQVDNPAQLMFEGKKNLMTKQVPVPRGMVQPQGIAPQASGLSPWEAERLKQIRAPRPAARPMQGPPIPQSQGPPAPLRHQLGAPAGLPMRPAPGGMPRRIQPMIPRVPQVRPQGGGGNMLQMLMQMMRGGR